MFDVENVLKMRAMLALAFEKRGKIAEDSQESVDMVNSTLDAAAEAVLSCAYEMTGVEYDVDRVPDVDLPPALLRSSYERWASCAVALSDALVDVIGCAVENFMKRGQASTMMAHNIEAAGKIALMAASFMIAGVFTKSEVDMCAHGKNIVEKMKSIDNGDFVVSLAPA